MWDDDIAILAVRAILTYGDEAVTVLDTRAARQRLVRQFENAEMWQAIADFADEFLRLGRKIY